MIQWEDKIFRGETNQIHFKNKTEPESVIEVNEEEHVFISLCLFDETELNRCIQACKEEKLVAALVYIDNYEEALDSIEDVKRSLLAALIDRKVNAYFSKVDALVRKIEKDKYFVVFPHGD